MTNTSDKKNRDDECAIPLQIPADELRNFVLERDEFAENDVANYVLGQSAKDGDDVLHVERVKTEVVMGTKHEIWDVTTRQDRWWVITNMTNLYSQTLFPSLDVALSFHIGLMARMRSRPENQNRERSPFDEITRRLEQAENDLDHAVETEEFQAVGMSLRETLLSLIAACRRRVQLPPDAEKPKDADFKAWSEAFFDALLPGTTNKTMRGYFKSQAKESWELVNWLTHTTNATRSATLIALEATQHVTWTTITAVEGRETHSQERCPACSSLNLRTHFDYRLAPDGQYFQSCGKCNWHNHPSQNARDADTTERQGEAD